MDGYTDQVILGNPLNRSHRMRRTLSVLAALSLATIPARAQTVHDVAAYFGTAYTTGIEIPRVEQPMLGDNNSVWGMHAFYTHESYGDFGTLQGLAAGNVSGNAFGASASASFLDGRLGLSAMGGYLVPSCPSGVTCNGFASAGGSAIFRLLRAPISTDSGGRVTLSLRASAAWAFAPDSDRYVSATVGTPIAFSAPEGRNYRVVGFVTPGLAWATVKTLVPNFADSLVVFHHDGVRGMISGGVGFMPTGSGVGVSVGVQKIFVSHCGAQFGATLTWNMPRLGDR